MKNSIYEKSSMKVAIMLMILAIAGTCTVFAQQNLNLDKSSKMIVSGTSTLHDWESDVETIKTSGSFVLNMGEISKVQSLTLTIPAESIKSGKSGMDKTTYEALKTDKYPNIVFELISVDLQGGKASGKGKLNIAGTTHIITFNSTYIKTSSEMIFKGVVPIDMTEYGIEPPTAVFGTIKTGKDVEIKYELKFNL